MFALDTTETIAAITLVVFAIAPALWLAIVCWRSPNFKWYQVPLVLSNLLITRVLWRAQVSGQIRLDGGRGAVIVANHRSSLDPSVLQLAVNARVHWMVAGEYFKAPLLGTMLRMCEAIPTRRGGVDTAATKMTIRCAERGELVGVFPEGRINDTEGLLLPGRCGAAMVALRARVPMIPCYIEGMPYSGSPLGCLIMPAKVRVHIGDPIDITEFYGRESDREVLDRLTHRCLKQIARMAGRPDYPVEIAGRRTIRKSA